MARLERSGSPVEAAQGLDRSLHSVADQLVAAIRMILLRLPPGKRSLPADLRTYSDDGREIMEAVEAALAAGRERESEHVWVFVGTHEERRFPATL